jgi:DNA-binding SARP family transcriptional activator/Flp pilus assembly protein TadD
VWGGREPDDPRSTLYSGVSRLRKILGPGLIETRDAGYLLRTDADHLDLLRFDGHLARARGAEESGDGEAVVAAFDDALALWSEPVLGGVEAPFVAEAAAELTGRYLRVCERRASWCLKLGRHADVVSELSPLVQAHPTRAGLAEQLMLALYRSERRAEAVHVYAGLKAALGSGMDCAAGQRAGELHTRILRDDPALVSPRPAVTEQPAPAPSPTPAPARRVPRQLPGATSRFIGRDEELAALDQLLAQRPPDDERNLVLAVDGTAGVGKTTLAVQWAHSVSEWFDGGQLYANLRGYDLDAPTEATSVLASFLVALGHRADQIPEQLGARAALFRAATAERRVLVLADNARDSQHVRPLLPGPGSLLLTTSRDQLRGLAAVNGAHRLTLRAFGEPEAIALLGRIAGTERTGLERQAAVQLVNLCARLPLAVAIAAEYAQRQPGASLADLADELRDEQSRLDTLGADEGSGADLHAVFTWSYRRLSASAARTFRLLSLHPSGGIHIAAAAALSGVPTRTALPWLDELVAAHLVESPAADHFAMHDLLRAYALDRVRHEEPGEEARAAADRLVAWYLATALRAQRRLRPTSETVPAPPEPLAPLEFADYGEALAWFDAEHANLTTLIHRTAEQPTAASKPVAADLLWQMRAFYNNRPYWDEWASLCRLAQGSGDALTEARLLSCLGTTHLFQRQLDEALAFYTEALRLIPDGYDGVERPTVLGQIGLARLMAGDAAQAVAVLHEAVEARFADDVPARLNLAGAYGALGKFEDALTYGREALEQHRRRGERDSAARALCNIAEAQLCLGRLQEGVDAAREAVQICRDIENVDGEVTALVLLGRILAEDGRRDDAREALSRALTLLGWVAALDGAAARQVRELLDALDADGS